MKRENDKHLPKRAAHQILGPDEIERKLEEMACAIYERVAGKENFVLVGIRTGGVYLARRLQKKITAKSGRDVPVGILDIGLYRDDWTRMSTHPIVRSTELPFSIDELIVVLVDDVLFTGRTVRAAMDALIDYGRPQRIELAVLVDRGHRELPICANYVGLALETGLDEMVNVYLQESSGEDRVTVESR